MNKQALVFGVGGLVAAVIMVFLISNPINKNQDDQNVLSEADQPAQKQKEKIPQKDDTIDELNKAKKEDKAMNQNEPPQMQIDTTKSYTAIIKTSEGDITVQLNASATPVTVNNFVALSRDEFYNDTIFHRIINGFMIQGGDPNGDGTGGPGYKFDDEPFEGEYTSGTIAMANSGPNTNGSQFFIMHKDYSLPPNYVIFGKVASGMDVVDTIATSEVVTSQMGEASQPVTPVKVTSVKIVEE